MTRPWIGGLALAMLLTPPVSAAPTALDPTAVTTVRTFLKGLASDIQGAVSGADGARERLLKRGRLTQALGREIDQVTTYAREAGGMTSVLFNTVELKGTVWFGIVPLKEVELHLVLAPDRVRLLRSVVRDTRLRVFGRPPATTWTDEGDKAFGAIATQLIRTMTDGGCDALPQVGPKDHKALLPKKRKARKNTLATLSRFATMNAQSCEALSGVPNQRVTWRFGELGGTVRTEGEAGVPFKVTLTHDGEGTPMVFHLRARPPAR